ncbi:hypothetical protein GW17_00011336 [Ensete ventricosum]|nr:hypothetical protein GW17_00011336 [Ensete ventricosum]
MPENPSPGPQLGTLFEKRISHFHLSRCRILEFRYLLGVSVVCSIKMISLNCCDAASGVQHLNICIWSVA